MKGKDPQKALLGGSAVGHDPAAFEARVNLGPEIDEVRSVGELIRRDAVNRLRSPSDRTRGAEMGAQRDNR